MQQEDGILRGERQAISTPAMDHRAGLRVNRTARYCTDYEHGIPNIALRAHSPLLVRKKRDATTSPPFPTVFGTYYTNFLKLGAAKPMNPEVESGPLGRSRLIANRPMRLRAEIVQKEKPCSGVWSEQGFNVSSWFEKRGLGFASG